eukprot:COSAG04_NODE_7761_length_1071_cov_1.445473_3_plen_25_part_01
MLELARAVCSLVLLRIIAGCTLLLL